MLALGIMAIVSLGLAGLIGGGDDADVESNDVNNDEVLGIETEPEVEVEIETAQPVTQPTSEVEPTQPSNEADQEEDIPDATDPQSAITNTLAPPPVPPAPELTLSEMVAVETADGVELSDDQVLVEGPETGEDQDRTFVVQAPETAHSINLGYHPETTFAVTPNEQTTHISASLNTNISGGESSDYYTTEIKTDDQGNDYRETILTREYANNVDIVLNVDQSQVGSHVAEIDLSNPEDTLRFKFTHINGFMHQIINEVETNNGDENTTQTTRTLYVIETSLDVPELAPEEIERIITRDGAVDSQTQLVAEIHLGTSTLSVETGGSENVTTAQTIADYTNESPEIRTNFYWASQGEHDGSAILTSSPVPQLVT